MVIPKDPSASFREWIEDNDIEFIVSPLGRLVQMVSPDVGLSQIKYTMLRWEIGLVQDDRFAIFEHARINPSSADVIEEAFRRIQTELLAIEGTYTFHEWLSAPSRNEIEFSWGQDVYDRVRRDGAEIRRVVGRHAHYDFMRIDFSERDVLPSNHVPADSSEGFGLDR